MAQQLNSSIGVRLLLFLGMNGGERYQAKGLLDSSLCQVGWAVTINQSSLYLWIRLAAWRLMGSAQSRPEVFRSTIRKRDGPCTNPKKFCKRDHMRTSYGRSWKGLKGLWLGDETPHFRQWNLFSMVSTLLPTSYLLYYG